MKDFVVVFSWLGFFGWLVVVFCSLSFWKSDKCFPFHRILIFKYNILVSNILERLAVVAKKVDHLGNS